MDLELGTVISHRVGAGKELNPGPLQAQALWSAEHLSKTH